MFSLDGQCCPFSLFLNIPIFDMTCMAAGVGGGISADNKFRFMVHVDFQVDCERFFLMVQLWLSLLLVLWFVFLFAGVVFPKEKSGIIASEIE